ncbi:MAG: hypothetical protein EP326_02985 [Deltaproteobacteria bacterium]|nr:MAG: hypothetical protein EP326_02985 [Deltaproteobacteria bacterium]TNF24426.1 MAG: hypothetical protein EP319_18630 [Deltaproteobacteria bacterium]
MNTWAGKPIRLITFMTLYFLASSLEAAKLPSRSRYEFTVGHATTKFVETRNFGSVIPQEQSQKGLSYALTWQYFFIPPWFDMELKAQYTDGSLQTSDTDGHQYKWVEYIAKTGFTFPLLWERIGIRISAEYFYLKNLDPWNQYSLEFNNATQVYPEIVLYPTGYHTDVNYSFYFKKPITTVNYEGDELTIGVVFYIPLGGGKGLAYPLYAYQKALVFRAEYVKLDIYTGTATRYNNYTQERTTLSIGFNF